MWHDGFPGLHRYDQATIAFKKGVSQLDHYKVGRGLRPHREELFKRRALLARPQSVCNHRQGHGGGTADTMAAMDQQRTTSIGPRERDGLTDLIGAGHLHPQGIIIDVFERQDKMRRLWGSVKPQLIRRAAGWIFQGEHGVEASLVTPSLPKAGDDYAPWAAG